MTVVLRLEAIGDDMVAFNRSNQRKLSEAGVPEYFQRNLDLSASLRKTWVAEIEGHGDHYKWERRFLKGNKDYSQANSIGSRGVMVYYHLKEGPVYEVHSWVSWSSVDRYFCRVEEGVVIRMTEEEVELHVGS